MPKAGRYVAATLGRRCCCGLKRRSQLPRRQTPRVSGKLNGNVCLAQEVRRAKAFLVLLASSSTVESGDAPMTAKSEGVGFTVMAWFVRAVLTANSQSPGGLVPPSSTHYLLNRRPGLTVRTATQGPVRPLSAFSFLWPNSISLC